MALTSLSNLAGAAAPHPIGHGTARARAAAFSGASSFGTMLGIQPDALGASDPLAALTASIQNGTPLSTIVSTLAGQIADAVQRTLPAAQQSSGTSRAQLVDSIADALAPPGTAPPGTTAAQQAAALARRLQTWIDGVAREAERAGQQVETSGHVLDADLAKELPAQHDPKTSTTLDGAGASALANSLLAAAVAALPGTTSASPPTWSAESLSAKGTAAESEPANSPAASSASNDPADLLARMLARAAGVDARVNASTTPQQTTGTQQSGGAATAVRPNDGGTPVSADVKALTALLADAFGTSAPSAGSDAHTTDARTGSQQYDGAPSTAAAPAKSAASSNGPVTPFAVPAASASPANPAAAQQSATPSGNAGTFDPNAVIEQVVKGMAMRSNADGTSEVRLHLEPEQLGTVTLKLTVSGSSVSATAVAQNADVRGALVAHQHQLARSLSESGLKLTSFSVDLSGGDAGNDRNRDRTSGFGRHYAVHEVRGASGETDTGENTAVGPPLLPGSTVALLNYLA